MLLCFEAQLLHILIQYLKTYFSSSVNLFTDWSYKIIIIICPSLAYLGICDLFRFLNVIYLLNIKLNILTFPKSQHLTHLFRASQKAADGSPRSFALSAVEPHPWYKGYLGGSFLGLTLHIEGFTW